MDIIAGNWGLNTPYRASAQTPLRLYYGDFAGNGAVNIVEAEFDASLKKDTPRRGRDAISMAIPDIASRFPTYRAYSEVSVAQALGEAFAAARMAQCTTLDSTLFLNEGGHFRAVSLPPEAQFAPVYGISVADFNLDGNEDLFLAQNFFDNEPEVARADAGRGPLLLGDGKGGFKAVPGQESGIKIYGEQRGSAVCDFDHDGRPDLLVAQNGAETKLYRNQTAAAGLRVTLEDTNNSFNPGAVGAVIRLESNGKRGPAREIHAGSGYWSQDGATQIFQRPEGSAQLWVRWPGGKSNETVLQGKSNEQLINLKNRQEFKWIIRRE
jgi:hypothetical protein